MARGARLGEERRGWRAPGALHALLLLATGLAFGGSHAHAAPKSRIASAAVEATAGGQQITLRFSQAVVGAHIFLLEAPLRLVVDVRGADAAGVAAAGQGAVVRVRSGQFDADTARVVVELAEPMAVGTVEADDPAQLVVALRPVSAAEFTALVAKGRSRVGFAAAAAPAAPTGPPAAKDMPAPAPQTATAKAPPAKPAATAPAVAPAASAERVLQRAQTAALPPAEKTPPLPPQKVKPRAGAPVVVIDAGHGGKDVGATSVLDGRREKDVTLAIAHSIRRELEATGRYRVVMTRSDDRFLPLGQRVAMARNARAQLFVSVHADSAPVPEVRGASIYTLSEVASDKEAARLAAKENKADLIAGVNLAAESAEVSDILLDLLQRETMNVSAEFAAILQRELRQGVHVRSQFHRFAGFKVLKAPDVPSVLLESGYLSNTEDSRFLFSAAGQRAIAQGVRRAVDAHFQRRYAQR